MILFMPIPCALAALIAGILLYYHTDGLVVLLAASFVFLGVLLCELKEYGRWIDTHTPGV